MLSQGRTPWAVLTSTDSVVDRITAYLFMPAATTTQLGSKANAGKSFQGGTTSMVMGFTFDDTGQGRRCLTRSAMMHELIAKDRATPSGSSRTSAARKSTIARRMRHHRYVINFGQMTEVECRRSGPT